ncbi:MAG: DUF1566 domain-containing protein [Pseudomonadota bacterium]
MITLFMLDTPMKPRHTFLTYFGVATMLITLSGCGIGTGTPPPAPKPDIRNLAYSLTLNDTGVTKFINGPALPALTTPTLYNTTTYSYFVTNDVAINAGLDVGTAINGSVPLTLLKFYDNHDPVYADCSKNPPPPPQSCVMPQIAPKIYAFDGVAYTPKITFTKTADNQWTVDLKLSDVNNVEIIPTTTDSKLLTFIPIPTYICVPPDGLCQVPDSLSGIANNQPSTILYTVPGINTSTGVEWKIKFNFGNTYQTNATPIPAPTGAQNGCAKPTVTGGNIAVPNCGWKNYAVYDQFATDGDLRATTPAAIATEPVGYPGQDATTIKSFKFTKLNNTGDPVPSTGGVDAWVCTKDEVTGLYWEHKSDVKSNPRYYQHNYTWYDSNAATNGGYAGVESTSSCSGVACNTEKYIQYVNSIKLCGRSDWRLPVMMELYSIIDFSRKNGVQRPTSEYMHHVSTLANTVMVNADFSINLETDDYWTSQTEVGNIQYVHVLHLNLLQTSHPKSFGMHILLVAGKPMQ